MSRSINWTPARLKRLKAAHAQAVAQELPEFAFDPKDEQGEVTFVLGYAKYLIEYLELQFKQGR